MEKQKWIKPEMEELKFEETESGSSMTDETMGKSNMFGNAATGS